MGWLTDFWNVIDVDNWDKNKITPPPSQNTACGESKETRLSFQNLPHHYLLFKISFQPRANIYIIYESECSDPAMAIN